MIPMSAAEVADAVGARLVGPAPTGDVTSQPLVHAVTADSREAGPGSLFVALPGSRVDGHLYVPAAVAAGAVAALTARPVPGALCLVVPDPLAALGRLARAEVDRAVGGGLTPVGVTGSQGKTSTKDLLGQVLARLGPTLAPSGNLNNELGLPLTVCRLTEQTRFLVAEMGARGVGHIAYLCRICPPQIGVVLNVGQAHVGEFGSPEATALAKAELVQALPTDGHAVLNADDRRVWAMREQTAAAVVASSAYGEPDWPEALWATDVAGDDLGRFSFALHRRGRGGGPEQTVGVRLRLSGRHQVSNAVAAAAVATVAGLELPAVAEALGAAELRSRWRMEIGRTADDVVVVNDAYNANPESMASALETVAGMVGERETRSWAVLGDMLELGPVAEAEHRRIGRLVGDLGYNRLVAVGTLGPQLVEGARAAGMGPEATTAVPDAAAAVAAIRSGLAPGDVGLVKASRGLALDTVAAALTIGSARPEGTEAAAPSEAEDRG